jgi:hypothetical protein
MLLIKQIHSIPKSFRGSEKDRLFLLLTDELIGYTSHPNTIWFEPMYQTVKTISSDKRHFTTWMFISLGQILLIRYLYVHSTLEDVFICHHLFAKILVFTLACEMLSTECSEKERHTRREFT